MTRTGTWTRARAGKSTTAKTKARTRSRFMSIRTNSEKATRDGIWSPQQRSESRCRCSGSGDHEDMSDRGGWSSSSQEAGTGTEGEFCFRLLLEL